MRVCRRIGSVAALLLAAVSGGACSEPKPTQKEEPMPVALLPKHEGKPKPPPPKILGIEWARFTPDGKKIITFEDDGSLNIWDATKDKVAETDTLPEATLATDLTDYPFLVKDFVLVRKSAELILLNWKSRKEEWRTGTRRETTGSGSFSFFAITNDEVVGISDAVFNINLRTGAVRRQFELPFKAFSTVSAVTPDGNIGMIANSSTTTLHFVDLKTGKIIKSISDEKRRVQFVFINPDGKRAITIHYFSTLVPKRGYVITGLCQLWDLEKVASIGEFEVGEFVRSVLVDTQFKRLIVSLESFREPPGWADVVIWDIEKRKKISEFKQDAIGARELVFSPDEQSLLLAGFPNRHLLTGVGLRHRSERWLEGRAMMIYDLKKGGFSRTIVHPLRGKAYDDAIKRSQ